MRYQPRAPIVAANGKVEIPLAPAIIAVGPEQATVADQIGENDAGHRF
jgi:hypothetical protein